MVLPAFSHLPLIVPHAHNDGRHQASSYNGNIIESIFIAEANAFVSIRDIWKSLASKACASYGNIVATLPLPFLIIHRTVKEKTHTAHAFCFELR